jgi:hypothetical protein
MTFKINKSQGITWNAIFLKNSPCDCVRLALICTTKTSASSGNFSERIHALGRLLQNFFLNHVLPVKTQCSGGKVVTKNVTVKKKKKTFVIGKSEDMFSRQESM